MLPVRIELTTSPWLARILAFVVALAAALAGWAAFIRVTAPANAALPPAAEAPNSTLCAAPAVAIEGDAIIARWVRTGDAARAFAAALAQVIDLPFPAVTAAAVAEMRSGFAVVTLMHPDGACTSVLLSPLLWQRILRRAPLS